MKEEQIEKAAIKRLPYSDEECGNSNYTLGKNVGFKRGFIAGAQWRINSVWHDASEMPEHGRYVLCVTAKRICSAWYATTNAMQDFKRFDIKQWAYLSDFVPEGIKE